jgi:hypothetical protein
MSKIKSIKVIKDYKFSLWDKTLEDLIKLNPEAFEVEYEKPKILKRPDGSVISGLEDGAPIIGVCSLNNLIVAASRTYDQNLNLYSLQSGLIYLPEDKHLAEKKAKQIPKQSEIKLEIDRLNAEEGGITTDDDYYFIDLTQNNFVKKWDKSERHSPTHCSIMSEATAETILAKYSQDELKQYLGIII